MMAGKGRKISLSAFFLAALGAGFSIWNSLDAASVPCLTEGCTLFQTFTIGGFSLWWAGVGMFSLLAVLALTGALGAGWVVSGLALGVDCILLVIMGLTAPCFACMVVAVLLALCFWRFRDEFLVSGMRNPREVLTRSWLLALWSLLFVVNMGLMCYSAVTPWPILGAASGEPARTSIYFSTSCGACRQLIMGLPVSEADKIAWYPVAEDGQGLFAVSAMHRAIQEGVPLERAFRTALEAPVPSAWEIITRPNLLLLQFRLWVNQAHVLRSGSHTMPFVEFRGLPEALLRKNAPAPATDKGRAAPDLPFLNLQSVGECTDGKTPGGENCSQ